MTDKDKEPEEIKLYNLDLERAVLGLCLMHPTSLDLVSPILLPEYFYEKVHGGVYQAMLDLISAGAALGPSTLTRSLSGFDFGSLTKSQFIGRIVNEATTALNAIPYAQTIVGDYKRRQMIQACEDIKALVYKSSYADRIPDLISEACACLDEVGLNNGVPEGVMTFDDAMKNSLEQISKTYQKENKTAGLSTGLSTLDEAIGGLSETDVIIVAGRPGMAKTALAVKLSESVAKAAPHKNVLFFSQEMSATQLATRQMSKESKIAAVKLRNGDVSQEEWESLIDAQKALEGLSVVIDAKAGIKLSHVASRMRQLSRKKPLSLVVIDYLQLMQGGGKSKGRGDNRNQELSEITAGLKTLAKEFTVPIIVLSQLSRECEKRDDKRPMLSDLRDSGSIEQDADIVMMLYREEYYLLQNFPRGKSGEQIERWHSEMSRWKGLAEVIVAKNRHGPQGTYMVGFDGDTTSFRELEDDERQRESKPAQAKVRLSNAASRAAWDAIRSALERIGIAGRTLASPPDSRVVTYQECVVEYLASMPAMEGDDSEAIDKKARREFREGVLWLKNEGAIRLHNEEINGVKDAWLWLGDRGVRR